ncbi:hypothetical protein ACJMK2_041172 [Sinanodonta woodiana]|uniref:Uncharacterized protein n=1 Tax=Sinanodonta woodiana TaxID=1069815 RepID=A0ABD3W659_SINWO
MDSGTIFPLILINVFVHLLLPVEGTDYYGRFPSNFMWGLATSAHQIEGAWNASGKSEHIWDRFCHAGKCWKGDTGDVACDSFHKYMVDVQLLKKIGVTHYRFSLAWTRIIPNPLTGKVNQEGLNYYRQLIDELQRNNIIPLVTIFHWDLPQSLEDIGSWANDSLVGYYNHYADVVFKAYGDKVKHWITFNEPWVICWMGYGTGEYAPGIKEPATRPYKCAHTIIKSHAEAYHTYNDKYRNTQKGQVGITMNSDFMAPKDPHNKSHIEAATRAQQFNLGWFAHPIFKSGDYPDVMKNYVAKNSPQGTSRLPNFTAQEIARNNGSADFLGLNHYTTSLVEPLRRNDNVHVTGGYIDDQENILSHDPAWPGSGSTWLFVVPWGFRNLLNWIRTEYGNPQVIVTENGVTDNNGTVQDKHRVDYYRAYITEMLKAINEDKCNVTGYTAWSLMDNFEWSNGYHEKFGIHYINFSDPELKRVPKDSAIFFQKLITENGFPDPTQNNAAVCSQKIFISLVLIFLVYFLG